MISLTERETALTIYVTVQASSFNIADQRLLSVPAAVPSLQCTYINVIVVRHSEAGLVLFESEWSLKYFSSSSSNGEAVLPGCCSRGCVPFLGSGVPFSSPRIQCTIPSRRADYLHE